MFGFTKQELYIVRFLIGALLVGAGVKLYKTHFYEPKLPEVDPAFTKAFEASAARINPPADDSLEAALSDQLELEQSLAAPSEQQEFTQPESELKININVASEAELQNLPNVGPVIAKRIVRYRNENGGFKQTEDLLKVKGIGKKTLAKIESAIVLN